MELGERKLKVLAAIIDAYIATGEPIGSKALCAMLDLSVSSATIRNDMADLSEWGFLEQPHTSAGRIPSPLGYRLYVDRLMGRKPLSAREQQEIDSMLEPVRDDPQKLLSTVSSAMAELTRLAALSTTTPVDHAKVVRCELIPAGRRTAVILLITSAGILKNRLCRTDADLTEEMAEMFGRISSEQICGRELSEITLPFVQTIAAGLSEHALVMTPLLIGIYEAVRDACELQVMLTGQANLLMQPEFLGERAQELFRFLSRREMLAKLMMQSHGGIKVLIGNENSRPELTGSSVVVTRYRLKGKEAGAIGVIGPTRMNYAAVIPHLEYFSQKLGRLLSENMAEDAVEPQDGNKSETGDQQI
ncbi:MAG: heat-inducible transcription repressor HrcA [Clostridiales bacterium]|nr:heat-inducible transcription repressor HrcA [Clostridiales bacterium]